MENTAYSFTEDSDYLYFLKHLDNGWNWDVGSGYFTCFTKQNKFPRRLPWGCGIALFLNATNKSNPYHPTLPDDTWMVTYQVFPHRDKQK